MSNTKAQSSNEIQSPNDKVYDKAQMPKLKVQMKPKVQMTKYLTFRILTFDIHLTFGF